MIVLKLLIQLAIEAAKIPMVRMMFYLCLGAVSKTLEALLIYTLPMDPVTHAVFVVLHFLVLLAFSAELLNKICKDLFGVPLFPRRGELPKKSIDTEGSVLERINPGRIWRRTTVPLPAGKQDPEQTRDVGSAID